MCVYTNDRVSSSAPHHRDARVHPQLPNTYSASFNATLLVSCRRVEVSTNAIAQQSLATIVRLQCLSLCNTAFREIHDEPEPPPASRNNSIEAARTRGEVRRAFVVFEDFYTFSQKKN